MPDVVLAIVTDLDGTLVDTREANVAAYRDAFASVALPFDTAAFDQAFGLAFDAMMDVIAPSCAPAQRAAVRAAKAHAYPLHLGRACVNQPLVTLLTRLHRIGHPVGLATTARRHNVLAELEYFNLLGLFDAMVTAEDVQHTKPDPECYATIALQLGVAPVECLVFEDSRVGISAARAAGCAVIEVSM